MCSISSITQIIDRAYEDSRPTPPREVIDLTLDTDDEEDFDASAVDAAVIFRDHLGGLMCLYSTPFSDTSWLRTSHSKT